MKYQVSTLSQAGFFPFLLAIGGGKPRSGWFNWRCAASIFAATVSGAAIVGATIVSPAIWSLPSTWYHASQLVAGSVVAINSNC